MRSWLSSLLFTLLFLTSSAQAKTVTLFQNGRPVPNYEEIVKSIQAGDVILFSDAGTPGVRTFIAIQDPINKGLLDLIVRIDETTALRIPKRPFGRSISVDESEEAYRTLKNAGVPVPEVRADLYLPKERLAVEWLDIEYTYDEFLENYKSLPRETQLQRLDEFVEFASKTWLFRDIGDQGSHQIAYVRGKGWMVIDALSDMSYVSRVEHGTIFTPDATTIRRGQYMMHTGEFISPYGEKIPFPDEKGYADKIIKAIRKARVENDIAHTTCYRITHAVKNFVVKMIPRKSVKP